MAENGAGRATAVEPYMDVPPAGEEEEASIDLVALFQTLIRGKKTILRIVGTAFVLAIVVAYLLPVKYTSTVSFIPPSLGGGSSMAAALAGQLSALGGGDLLGAGKTSGDLYAGILASRSVQSELVKKYHLQDVYKVKRESDAEKDLASNTSTVVDVKSTIVTVAVSDRRQDRAQELANAYMDALRETNGRLALGQSSQRRLFFEDQLAKEKDDLEDAEVDLKKTEEESGLIAPTGQTEAEIRSIAELQAEVAVRQVQLAALRDSATEQNPQVVRLHSEIDDLQGQLARMQKGNGASSVTSIPTSKVPALQLEYVRKTREVKYHEALFEMLSRQFEAARLDEARDAPLVQVLDSASYPDVKSSPKRSLIVLGALVLGLIAGCIWVLVREPLRALRASLAANETV
jgi:tyrosine-protein kinase Etk/Wzc